MLSPQEAYEALKREYPDVISIACEASFPDKKYYRFGDYRIDATQLEFLVDKETGEVIRLDDMVEILRRFNAVIDESSENEEYLEHSERKVIVKLTQPL